MVPVHFREVHGTLSGANVVGSVGDRGASGKVTFVIIKSGADLNIRYQVTVSQLSTPEKPTSASLHVAAATKNGLSILDLNSSTWIPAGTADKAWGNMGKLFGRGKGRGNGKGKGKGKTGAGAGNGFALQGVFKQASKKRIPTGESLKLLFSMIMRMPSSFYVLVTTPAFPKGALTAQLEASLFTKLAGCSRGFGC
ncbi:unnamed protein product [Closterium sp. Yama58-4]|nr:unnamed protein product [Closterium sp. Yama58-4]